MANAWLMHVAKCRKANPDWNLQKALTECRKTYTPVSGSKTAKKSKSRKYKSKGKRSKSKSRNSIRKSKSKRSKRSKRSRK